MDDKVCKCGQIHKEEAFQDQSLPILQDLLANGYTVVKYISNTDACPKCQDLNGVTWNLSDFIANLSHDAPIFEKSHVNDKCSIEVSGEGKEPILVDYRGVM